MSPALLRITGLSIDRLQRGAPAVNVVDDVHLQVQAGTTTALVGESGCGKSLTALAIIGLLEAPMVRRAGRVELQGEAIQDLRGEALRRVRGARIGMVFQEPMTALNPVYRVGQQITAVLQAHRAVGGGEARSAAVALLEAVGIPEPQRRASQYPHELSGGMKQRVMIAMALACEPQLLIADEPTTALDVTVQAQILRLLARARAEREFGMLLITHDLAVVAHHAEQVAIMYAGRIVETAPVRSLFRRPRHPYSRALLGALPGVADLRGAELRAIPGMVPAPHRYPSGCRFRDRCSLALPACAASVPVLQRIADGHAVACLRAAEGV